MTYETLTKTEEADFWAWVEAELSRPTCSFCQYWQPARLVNGQLRPAHCWAMAQLDRNPQPPNSYAQQCKLYRPAENARAAEQPTN